MNLNQLREQRHSKLEAMRGLVNHAENEQRDFNEDETKQFESLKQEERSLSQSIERAEYLAELEKRSDSTPITGNRIQNHEELGQKVSVLKVLRSQMQGRTLDGIEAEYSQETERRTGRKAEGAFIPLTALETRVNTTTSASELVADDHRADQYIGPLRNALLARRLGVRVLTGLTGNVTIPKHGSGLTMGWVAEGDAVPDGTMGFDDVSLTPKHVGGKTEMSRQLLQQSSPGIEALVRDDLSYLIARQIDSAIISGTGSSNEPLGIMSHPDVQTASLSTVSWANILGMQELIELANLSAANWLTSPDVKTVLASTLKETGIAGYLLENGMMSGFPLYATNQVASDSDGGKLILGDFSQVLLGVWSEIDILVNPYAEPAYSRGGVVVRAMATADVGLRHPQGFVVATDVALS